MCCTGVIFAGDALVFTLGLIKYEPRRFRPADKIVKVRLQGITVCDRIDALKNLGIIGTTGRSSTNSRNNVGLSRYPLWYPGCAYVLRISRYSDFLSVVRTNAGIFWAV